MLILILVTLAAAAAGCSVWAADKRRRRYGAWLLPCTAVVSALLAWLLLGFTDIKANDGLVWLLWAVPIAVSVVVSLAVSAVLGRRREAQDTAKLESVLRM